MVIRVCLSFQLYEVSAARVHCDNSVHVKLPANCTLVLSSELVQIYQPSFCYSNNDATLRIRKF